jgi:hypothetical protein
VEINIFDESCLADLVMAGLRAPNGNVYSELETKDGKSTPMHRFYGGKNYEQLVTHPEEQLVRSGFLFFIWALIFAPPALKSLVGNFVRLLLSSASMP